ASTRAELLVDTSFPAWLEPTPETQTLRRACEVPIVRTCAPHLRRPLELARTGQVRTLSRMTTQSIVATTHSTLAMAHGFVLAAVLPHDGADGRIRNGLRS